MIKRSKVLAAASDIVFDEEEVLNFIVQHPDFEALRVTFYEIEAKNTFDAQLLSCEDLTAQLRLKVENDQFEMDPEVAVRRIGEGIMPILSAPSRKTADVSPSPSSPSLLPPPSSLVPPLLPSFLSSTHACCLGIFLFPD